MPKSRVRKKSVYTPPQEVVEARAGRAARAAKPSPRWYAPLMVALMVLGLLWIVVFYVANEHIPFMNDRGAMNVAIGFGAMISGLVMSMRWREQPPAARPRGPRPAPGRGLLHVPGRSREGLGAEAAVHSGDHASTGRHGAPPPGLSTACGGTDRPHTATTCADADAGTSVTTPPSW